MSLPHRYLFIGGLHRSGTSLLARLIAAHPLVSAITDAPVPENEGCYLTGAIPHTARHGIPGHFATDPAQHHVEGSALDRLTTRTRLEADWAHWFDRGSPWRVEKSPVNLTRTRLLQSLFPLSHFVIVVRDPRYLAAAMRKWSDAGDAAMLRYWSEAHTLVLEDFAHLHHAMIVRYEDLVRTTEQTMSAIWHFLTLDPAPVAEPIANGNTRYHAVPTLPDGPTVSALGYDTGTSPALIRHPLRSIRERVVPAMMDAKAIA